MKNNVSSLYQSVINTGIGCYNFENSILNPTTGYFVELKNKQPSKYIKMPATGVEFRTELAQYFKQHSDDIFNFNEENYVVITQQIDDSYEVILKLSIYERFPAMEQAFLTARVRKSSFVIDIAASKRLDVLY